MAYDYSKLKGRIIEVCGTQGEFAKRMHLSEVTITRKMQQKIAFNQEEISRAVSILKLSPADIQTYFFNLKV